MKWLTLLHNFIQQWLDSAFAQIKILLAASQRFAMVRKVSFQNFQKSCLISRRTQNPVKHIRRTNKADLRHCGRRCVFWGIFYGKRLFCLLSLPKQKGKSFLKRVITMRPASIQSTLLLFLLMSNFLALMLTQNKLEINT